MLLRPSYNMTSFDITNSKDPKGELWGGHEAVMLQIDV